MRVGEAYLDFRLLFRFVLLFLFNDCLCWGLLYWLLLTLRRELQARLLGLRNELVGFGCLGWLRPCFFEARGAQEICWCAALKAVAPPDSSL